MRKIINFSAIMAFSLLLMANRCTGEEWVIRNDSAHTGNVECGVEETLFTNQSDSLEDVSYTFTNRGCDVGPAWWWIERPAPDSDSGRETVASGESKSGSVILKPGESIIFHCTMILPADGGKGCSWKVRVMRARKAS